MLFRDSQLTLKNIKYLGYLYLGLCFFGLILSLIVHRIDLMYRAMYIVLPLLIASYISFAGEINRRSTNFYENLTNYTKKTNIKKTLIIFNIVYLASILVLFTSKTRSIIYFGLIIILIIITYIEIISADTSKKSISLIVLMQNVLISLNLIWGITLKYELYFAGTDIVAHMRLIESIINQSHLTNALGAYLYYPFYHLLYSVSIILLGAPNYQSMFLISGLIFQIGIISSYLVTKSISKNEKVSLLASLLLVSSQEYVYYGTYVITRTISGIVFMILLYIILRKRQNIKFTYLYIFMLWVLILYHHVSMIFILMILCTFYSLDLLFGKITKSKLFTLNEILLLIIVFLSYALFIAFSFTKSALLITFTSELKSEVLLGFSSITNVKMFLMDNIDSSIFLLFYLIGTVFILKDRFQPAIIKKLVFFTLVFISIYLPTPLKAFTFLNDLLRFDRVAILVAPFMTMVMAYGVLYILNIYKGKKVQIILISLIIIYSFFSIVNTSNAPDYPIFHDEEKIPNRYFTEGELSGVNFLQSECKYNLYSDFFVYILLGEKPKIFMISENTFNHPHKGYILIRDKEWSSRTLLFLKEDMYPLRPIMYEKTAGINDKLEDNYSKLFNNAGAIIYYKE